MAILNKRKEILASKVLLQIIPRQNKSRNLFFLILFIMWSFLILAMLSVNLAVFPLLIILISVTTLLLIAFKDPLSFTEKGITKLLVITVYWHELTGYNYDVLAQQRKLLYVESKNHFLAHLRFLNLPGRLLFYGISFSDEEVSKIDSIFSSKGVPKLR